MKHDFSPALSWQRLRYHILALGWPALLGLGLVVGAVAVDLIVADEATARIAELRKSRNTLRNRLASVSPEAAGGVQLADLPERASVDPVIAEIHAAAQKSGVQLKHGEYRLQPEQGTRLARYRIALPARGSYPQLHAWLDEAIASQPGLVVDELTLKRDDIGSEMLEARVGLSLLVRDN